MKRITRFLSDSEARTKGREIERRELTQPNGTLVLSVFEAMLCPDEVLVILNHDSRRACAWSDVLVFEGETEFQRFLSETDGTGHYTQNDDITFWAIPRDLRDTAMEKAANTPPLSAKLGDLVADLDLATNGACYGT